MQWPRKHRTSLIQAGYLPQYGIALAMFIGIIENSKSSWYTKHKTNTKNVNCPQVLVRIGND
jgi:hypothetical protein